MARGIPGSKTDSNDLNTTQKSHIDMPADGMIDRSALREDGIDVAPAAGLSDYARELAFMEELVEAEVLSEFDDEDITLDSCFDQDKDPEIVSITIN